MGLQDIPECQSEPTESDISPMQTIRTIEMAAYLSRVYTILQYILPYIFIQNAWLNCVGDPRGRGC